MADKDEESNPPTLATIGVERDLSYLTEHLASHTSTTRHHLTALFFRALSTHSRFRPDLIAACIGGTKSTVDVAVYLSLLREGAARAEASRDGGAGAIARDQYPAAYEVSEALVALEDEHAARICAAEPARAKEEEAEARKDALRAVRNGMRVRRGEGTMGPRRDREGQEARKEEFERWRGEREVEWAREDVLARLDAVRLQVLDRMLRLDEEGRTEEAGSGDAVRRWDIENILSHGISVFSLLGTTRNIPTPSSPVPPTSDDDEDDDAGSTPSSLFPADHARIRKRLYMRRKRAEASGGVAQLDPARLKPGRKASATSKYRQPLTDNDNNNENPRRPARGDTRQYRIQREFERLGIEVTYLRANGLGLFHLGALGRLMRLYPRLDASRPEGVTESIAAPTIQTLHALVVQFTRHLVRRAIALREVDFALRAHTKVWRLGGRVVHPSHVRRALELGGGGGEGGGARESKHAHFEVLLGRYSEGDESTDGEGDEEEDVPLAVRARMKKGKAIARNGDEDEEEDEGEGEGSEQQAGPSQDADAQVYEVPGRHWSSSAHRAIYSPFVYAPDLVAPAHPFGVYTPGTTPEQLLGSPSAHLHHHHHHLADSDADEDEDGDGDADDDDPLLEEEQDELMPAETDAALLEAELRAEALLDVADARAAAAYEAGLWRELGGSPGGGAGRSLLRRRKRKRRADAAELETEAREGEGEDDGGRLPPRKRRKNVLLGGGGGGRCTPMAVSADALKSPDGVKVKSAAVIENSDSEDLG
ncbi:hypothetical protein BJV74DRAFT_889311 [Russula compacta]|nr:hypothetical protein BJV74DRAFT_889311 [Russula compacta]